MKKYDSLQSLCITALFILFLSGCAGQKDLSSIPQTDGDGYEMAEGGHDFIQLETLESPDLELEELSATGAWNDPPLSGSARLKGERFDFPVVLNRQVEVYLDLFLNKQRRQFGKWLARSGRYQAMMEREMEKAGIPKDLAYLAMIESGYKPLAYSRAKAVGLWQFMKPTGKQYNLIIDRYVDERRDAHKSTKAAARYLSDLYQEFGDWHLAIAAYNAGPGKVKKGLRRYNVDNFWDLATKDYFRLETKRYVPKLIATLIIARNPEKYGFTDVVPEKPIKYETLTVDPGISIDAIALVSDSTRKEIKKLNLELRQGRTPANRAQYAIHIPSGRGAIARKNITRLHSFVSTGFKTHRVKRGDTVTKISRTYGINSKTLRTVNKLSSNSLKRGQKLRIPYNTVTYQILPEGATKAQISSSLVLYKVKKGDNLGKIAQRHQVPIEMLVSWNGLKNSHSIRAGQQLAIYPRGISSLGTTRSVTVAVAGGSAPGVQIIRADKKKLYKRGKKPIFQYYRVKNGDSLWTISRKFSASTSDIKKWNNLKSNLIHPGAKLKLKKG